MKTLPAATLPAPAIDTVRLPPQHSQRQLFEQLLQTTSHWHGLPREQGERAGPEKLERGYPLVATEQALLVEDAASHPLTTTSPEEAEAARLTDPSLPEAMQRDVREHPESMPSRLQPNESVMPAPVPAVTAERAAVERALPLPGVTPAQDLQTLVDRLQLQLLASKADNRELTLLRARLPQLGPVEVHMRHVGAGLQVEIQAAPASLRQLQVACADLLDRLQRLDPAQQVSLGFAANGGGEQGSRNRRHVLDEWWPEQ